MIHPSYTRHDLPVIRRHATELHRQAEAHRTARSLRPAANGRSRIALTVIGGLAAIGSLSVAGIVGFGDPADAQPIEPQTVPIGCDRPDGYEAACRLIPGRPDGWYVSSPARPTEELPPGLIARIR